MEYKVHHGYYQALKARDSRFDGEFFVGVKTSKVYCRPICKARVPKEENCTFFTSSSEAESKGYRPCLLCRPEIIPGHIAHDSSDKLLDNIIKIIEENINKKITIQQIAKELNVSDRHIRRIFKEKYGVTPHQYIQTRRLHLAKNLLTDTKMQICDIATISGFGSVRRFNDVFKTEYKLTPSSFRNKYPNKFSKMKADEITLNVGYHEPYDYEGIIKFLKEQCIYGVEKVENSKYYRSIHLKYKETYINGYIIVSDNHENNSLKLTVSESLIDKIPQVLTLVRGFFDVYSNPYIISDSLDNMNNMFPNSFNTGLRIPGSVDDFEICVRSIVGQHKNVKYSTTILNSLVGIYGEKIISNIDRIYRIFPTPENLLDDENIKYNLKTIGLTEKQIDSIIMISKLFKDEKLQLTCSYNEFIDKVMELNEIKKDSIDYIKLRSGNNSDIILDYDNIITELFNEKSLEDMNNFEEYAPWRSYVTFALWNYCRNN